MYKNFNEPLIFGEFCIFQNFTISLKIFQNTKFTAHITVHYALINAKFWFRDTREKEGEGVKMKPNFY